MLVDYINPLLDFYNDVRVKKILQNCVQPILKIDI